VYCSLPNFSFAQLISKKQVQAPIIILNRSRVFAFFR
jgi:hypothetical protein